MEILRWLLPKRRFPKMRESERTLFFLLGHAVNEINVLNKLFYFSNNYDHEQEWRRHAHLTQGLVLARGKKRCQIYLMA